MPEKVLVTVAEAADMLSMSPRLVYDLANSGALTKRYLSERSRRFWIEAESVRQYAASMPTESQPA